MSFKTPKILSSTKEQKQWICKKQNKKKKNIDAGVRKEKQDIQTHKDVNQRKQKEKWYTWTI